MTFVFHSDFFQLILLQGENFHGANIINNFILRLKLDIYVLTWLDLSFLQEGHIEMLNLFF